MWAAELVLVLDDDGLAGRRLSEVRCNLGLAGLLGLNLEQMLHLRTCTHAATDE